MDDEYISFTQAAEIAGYRNPSALHAAARTGRLQSIAFGPHARVTTRVWLEDYLSGLRVGDYKRGEVRVNEQRRAPAPMMRWIEHSPFLHEARATLPDGRDLYVGYVAVRTGSDDWRGYMGADFTPVGLGPLPVVRRMMEERMCEMLEQGKGRTDSVS